MIVNDSTNKWHSGKKKQAADNAIKVAVFRKRHTHGPLTDQQIAAAVEDNKLQLKAKQSTLTLAEKRRQRKIRILAAKIKYDKEHPKPALNKPRKEPSKNSRHVDNTPDQSLRTLQLERLAKLKTPFSI